ncbi:substrate-binding domain-containing protein [Streptomyces californicus]
MDSGAQGLLLAPGLLPGQAPEACGWLDSLPGPPARERRSPSFDGPGSLLDSVGSDHRHGVLGALRHFASLGHERVLLAARSDSWTAEEVRAGYAESTRLLGRSRCLLDTLGPRGAGSDPAGSPGVSPKRRRPASGPCSSTTTRTPSSSRPCSALGLTVPDDIALIAYDDVFAALPPRR